MTDSAALLVDEILPHQPMRQWVLSVPFPLRFLFASNPKVMSRALGIVYRAIATHLAHKAGYTKPLAQTGAVTLIQRFGSALNLNIHFHMLFLDGVYIGDSSGHPVRFRWVKAPTRNELTQLTHTIAQRIARYLERQGYASWSTIFPPVTAFWGWCIRCGNRSPASLMITSPCPRAITTSPCTLPSSVRKAKRWKCRSALTK